jgi:exonuclease SbcC
LEYIGSIRDWIVDKFPVCLKDIERTILSTTASNFNKYFKEWFKVLVEEENIDIKINPENFQPIVNVNGYQSPFEDLSGGEKSALSLAYRLALNKVIISKYEKAKTNDLLILDEPTDGFSQKQVNKMQDILGRLDIEQMIIISHERTLDSFVTDIYNFEKVNHKTKIHSERL